MSWLTDLAGKAESLLNNIDQSAAGAIKNNETLSLMRDSPKKTKIATKTQDFKADQSLTPSTHSLPNLDYKYDPSLTPTRKPSRKPPTSSTRSSTKIDEDAALFDFLNSSNKPSTPRTSRTHASNHKMRKSNSSTSVASTTSHSSINNPILSEKTKSEQNDLTKEFDPNQGVPPHVSLEISRNSSFDSMTSKTNPVKIGMDNVSNSSEGNEPSSEPDIVSYPLDTASESEFELVSNTGASSVVASERDSGEEAGVDGVEKGIISNLKMENRLLQNEIAALHQEMKSLTERNIRNKADLEKRLNEIQRKSDDLNQEYNVKNSQVQAMKIQMNELENENKSLKRNVDSLKTEKERIIDDQSAGNGVHAEAIDQLRSRLEEAESSLIRERDANRTLQGEAIRERERNDEEVKKLADTLRKSDAEKLAQKKRLEELSKEITILQGNLTANTHELSDYKQKASRILQSKERLIASLKGGSEAELTASTTTSIELEELRQERDSLREELITTRSELSQMKSQFQEMEGQYQQENTVLQEEADDLRRSLDDEMRARREAETDVSKYEHEVRREREEATRARAAANERLQDKEGEIQKLRSQLMMRSRNAPEESELESRLHQLTETLLQKQTIVETMSAEKSSLILQLERAEGQIKRLSQENSTRLQITSDTADHNGLHNRSNINSAMFDFSAGPQHGVVGHVKKAASAVDRFSVRLGVFLRRYPIARLFVIVYMGLLHLWVMIVLLTYSPEIHGVEYHAAGALSDVHGAAEHQVDHGLPKDN